MERIQNKVAWALVVALSLLVIAALAGVVRGGPLDPTAPPGSTGKNVITSLPFTISQPGSYVLNGNLTCTTCTGFQNGITVSADNVTIDLQGFELVGVAGSGDGVSGQSGADSLTVRNGTIRNWGLSGVETLSFTKGLVVDEVHILDNTEDGVRGALNSRITNCHVVGPQTDFGVGISVNSGIVSNCIVSAYGSGIFAGDGGSIVENCVVTGAGSSGIYLGGDSIVRGCNVSNNLNLGIWIQGPNNTIEGSQVVGNAGIGIRVEGANNTIRGSELVRTSTNKDIHLIGTSPGPAATGTVARDTTFTAQSNCAQIDAGAGLLVFNNTWHSAGSC